MDSFVYSTLPSRIIFGSGTFKKLPEELERQKLTAPFIITGPRQVDKAQELASILHGNVTGTFSEAKMHTPVEITEKAMQSLEALKPDCVVSIGGGSAIGLGKAISFRTGLPHICLPTTYSGSETTTHLGETENGVKLRKADPKILPGTVIYDVDLTFTLPASMSATSGVNAIAHAVEALYGRNKNPLTSIIALEGIKALVTALPSIIENPLNQSAREKALYGAWLCGTCLGTVEMGLHHKLCHTLGGSFNMPHAETHTIVLPHALAYNAPKIPEAMKKLADVFPKTSENADRNAINGLNKLLADLNVKRGLKDYGMKEEDIAKATDIAMSKPYWNPREIEKPLLQELLRRCWAGEEARDDL